MNSKNYTRMKRLTLKEESVTARPAPPVYGSEKERLIGDIHDYHGKDGYLPVTEHGNRPTLNASAFDYDGMILRFPIGKERRRRIDYSEMDEQMLKDVIIEIFRYYNFCHLYA